MLRNEYSANELKESSESGSIVIKLILRSVRHWNLRYWNEHRNVRQRNLRWRNVQEMDAMKCTCSSCHFTSSIWQWKKPDQLVYLALQMYLPHHTTSLLCFLSCLLNINTHVKLRILVYYNINIKRRPKLSFVMTMVSRPYICWLKEASVMVSSFTRLTICWFTFQIQVKSNE